MSAQDRGMTIPQDRIMLDSVMALFFESLALGSGWRFTPL
jgi:hypothetical protein